MSNSTHKDELEKQIKDLKDQLEVQESLLVDRAQVISSLKSDIARNEDELADIGKPVMTREQAMQVHDAIISAVERFEFNDPDEFEYGTIITWQLADDIWEKVSECFGEFTEENKNE